MEKFINKFREGLEESGYGAGEIPEFSQERVEMMLEDLLELAAEKAKIKVDKTKEGIPIMSSATVDKDSILNILNDE